ncbi:hypothetical protein E1B28_008355 [Marasmius oreades]|uniref:NADAR domain-containing protein n=1 Tax=Marasmius oreades TaxID=181124 RepID=A0A9P7UT79_9AGAR|nr:uncharacterized protein E1B28_008355 [Marasmius oreades]KAG7091966.1 hypothetical protein E1B28_008355 [Marasmius oreades]
MPKSPSTNSTSTTATSENYVFFWKPNERDYGWASQWYPSPFTLQIEFPVTGDSHSSAPESKSKSKSKPEPELKECTFPTAEHYMMFRKALLFEDTSIAELVLSPSHSGTSQSDLAEIKALGRQVQNFDEDTWKAHRYRIVLDGNLAKFRQNPHLKDLLLSTGSRKHVEASPRDRIWGIGYGHVRAAKMVNGTPPQATEPKEWGLNLLGKALDEARKILQEEASSIGGFQFVDHRST